MRDTIMIIDDQSINIDLLTLIMQDRYNIISAFNGEEGIEKIEAYKNRLLIILLDLYMPVMDGFQVLNYISKSNLLEVVPVVVISGDNDINTERNILEMGVTDFIKKPFDHIITKKKISNIIELYNYKSSIECKLQDQLDKVKEQAIKLKKINTSIINIMGSMVESRSLESGEHINRVRKYTYIIANYIRINYHDKYQLTFNDIDLISDVSMLHDIGKIAIPDNILLKLGKLTDEEFGIIKTHTIKGAEIINNISNNWDKEYLDMAYNICRYHHERWDGRGYPDKLKEDEIPISAQIVSITDVFDALTHKRCYKDSIDPYDAYLMILRGECGTFNPILLESLREKLDELVNMIRLEQFRTESNK